jgi:pimeloyl-ACP methyl ester carboxylesterase
MAMPKVALKTGVELYYEEHGKGVPVILLQGTGFALDVWQPHPVRELSANHRVITIDPRGIGRSLCEDAVLSIDQIAADIVELFDKLAVEPIHVIGHSIGGRIGIELALNYPGRIRSLVLAASGSGSAVRPGEDAFPMPQHRLLVRLIERGLKEHVRYEILETEGYFTDKFRAAQRGVVEEFWETAWQNHADVPWYLRYVMARHAYEATHRLPFLKLPVLILVGSSDHAGGGAHFPASKMMADRIRGSELKIMEGVSHGFFWEKPEMTAEILENWFRAH